MIYLDNGATSFVKPREVIRAVDLALQKCANPGRGGYDAAMAASRIVFECRREAAALFGVAPEQVIFTANCTHSLNIAIHSLVNQGSRVVISGFEHNAVVRPLHARNAKIRVAGRKLFDWEDTLREWELALKEGADAAVFTQVSNVFGYILPVDEMAALCRNYGVPFIVDAAQAAGSLPVSPMEWGASFVAMPGHKGLLGPQGTGILLCMEPGKPLMYGGTGTESENREMPEFLPERMEAGTLNVPGIAGLCAGIRFIRNSGADTIFRRENSCLRQCVEGLKRMGISCFSGEHHAATVSFLCDDDCEAIASGLAHRGIAVRAGLHCAPLAHESAGTDKTGTVRISFGYENTANHVSSLIETLRIVTGKS